MCVAAVDVGSHLDVIKILGSFNQGLGSSSLSYEREANSFQLISLASDSVRSRICISSSFLTSTLLAARLKWSSFVSFVWKLEGPPASGFRSKSLQRVAQKCQHFKER